MLVLPATLGPVAGCRFADVVNRRLPFGLLSIASQADPHVFCPSLSWSTMANGKRNIYTYTLTSRCNSIASIRTSPYVYYSLVNPPPFLTMAHSKQFMEYSNKKHLASSLKQALYYYCLVCYNPFFSSFFFCFLFFSFFNYHCYYLAIQLNRNGPSTRPQANALTNNQNNTQSS